MATATKYAATARGSKLLQGFARKHGLDIQVEDESRLLARDDGLETQIDDESLNYLSAFIQLGENAAITDPNDDPFLIDMWGSKIALTQALRRYRVKNPLILVLFQERRNNLCESIGFDILPYDNESGIPKSPNSSNWGKILQRVGLRHFDGDDDTISFLFPSRDKASVALALALAGLFEFE